LLLAVLEVVCPAAPPLRFEFREDPLRKYLARAASDRTGIPCKKAPSPLAIDGKLDEESWRGAAPLRLRKSSAALPDTTFRTLFDRDNLYVGVECSQKKGVAVIAEQRPRDGGAWKDDCAEIWIGSPSDPDKTYQFIVNAAGAFSDYQKGSYDPDWRRAVSRDGDSWTIELAVPRQALGLDEWYSEIPFNLGRNGPNLAPHTFVGDWKATSKSFLALAGVTRTAERKKGGAEEKGASDFLITSGKGIKIKAGRFYVREGERFAEIGVRIDPRVCPDLGECEVKGCLYGIGGRTPLADAGLSPELHEGVLHVDVRELGVDKGQVVVQLLQKGAVIGSASCFLTVRQCAEPFAEGDRIEIKLDVPEGAAVGRPVPVTFGVPFGAGRLWDAERASLADGSGAPLPCQREVTARWAPEGSIKWLRFDALVEPGKGCCVVADDGRRASTSPQVRVSEENGRIAIENGDVRYVLGKGPSPIEEVHRGGRLVAASKGAKGLYVTDQKDRIASAVAEEESMVLEARGPVAACVRFEGWYATDKGERLARHITRVECFAGDPQARVTHTLVLTRDTNEVWFRDIGWEFAVEDGEKPEALFGSSRSDWREVYTHSLAGSEAVYMLQDSHFMFAHGDNHFRIGSAAGADKILQEGEECGDWAALRTSAGGLMVGCEDAARQHPKEFEISRNKVVLKLFSVRAGEELDFRTEALLRKWDLQTWYENTHSARRRDKAFVEKVRAIPSNAIGWSKTHELSVCPVTPDDEALALAARAHLNREPVYALADPAALYASKAMGPLHPQDKKRFPRLEKAVMAAFDLFAERDGNWGEHGFVDYFAGPHLRYSVSDKGTYAGMFRYCYNTYTLRSDLWYLYARSGERRVRQFAEGTNRTFMDGIIAHWDGVNTVRGLIRANSGLAFSLPFYWGPAARLEIASSTNHENLMNYHYLTGCRRAKDCMDEYVDGIKRFWAPDKAKRTGRIIMLFRYLVQAYGFSFDPELKVLAEETFNLFSDERGVLGLTKDRPYDSTSYKASVDSRALLEAWDLFGDDKYREMALKFCDYYLQMLDHPRGPVMYAAPYPRLISFLYDQTGGKMWAELLALQLRRTAKTYDPGKDALVGVGLAAHNSTFYFEGVPYSLDVVCRSGADKGPLASWVGYTDFGFDASVIVSKEREGDVTLYARIDAGQRLNGTPVGGTRVNPLRPSTPMGLSMLRVSEGGKDSRHCWGTARIDIPMDAPAGEYEVLLPNKGGQFVIADKSVPMVLYAPQYWKPRLLQSPPVKYYFKVTGESEDPQIFFEGGCVLFAPDGEPAFEGKTQHGWVSLPKDRKGLWSFEVIDNGLVAVRNIPPFFAMSDRSHFFLPSGIPAASEATPEKTSQGPVDTSAGKDYVPGALNIPGDQAIHLAGRRQFQLEPGDPDPDGDGDRFLPFKQGTIEFLMRPDWSTFSIDKPKTILAMRSSGETWVLSYNVFPEYQNDPDWKRSHVLHAHFLTDGKQGKINGRVWRQTVISPGEWTHIAWVWGPERKLAAKGGQTTRLDLILYVNGKKGLQYSYAHVLEGNEPVDKPQLLYLCPGGAYDELRLSDVQRYTEDFTAPSRDVELRLDEHTRALFHFNGNLDGESCGYDGKLPAVLE